MAYLKYIISSIVVLLCITVAYGGDRRTTSVYNDGSWVMVPDIGECDDTGCITHEHITQGGLLYQWYTDDNGVCTKIIVWKPLVDPTYGTFYTIYRQKTCK